MTHNSLRVVIVGQTSPPKIAIVEQPFFILMVLHVVAHILRAYRRVLQRFFFTDQGKNFTKLQLVIFTRLQQRFVV